MRCEYLSHFPSWQISTVDFAQIFFIYWCYNKYTVRVYTYIFCLAHFRSCVTRLLAVFVCLFVCLFDLFSRVLNDCITNVAAPQMYIFELIYSSWREEVVQIYIREVTLPLRCLIRNISWQTGCDVTASLQHRHGVHPDSMKPLRKLQYLLIPFTRK